MTTPMVTKRHPVRGALYGIVLGVGLAAIAIGRKLVALDSALPWVLLVLGIVVGGLWGAFAPPKKPRDRPARSIESRREEEAGSAEESTADPAGEPEEPGSDD